LPSAAPAAREMDMRLLLSTLLGGALLVAAYVGSALVSVDVLADAVRSGNAAEVIARTDVPRVRASLTGQIAEAVLEAEGNRRVLSPLERSVIGGVVTTVVDEVVATVLDPVVLTAALRDGRVVPARGFELSGLPHLSRIDAHRIADAVSRLSVYRINELALRLSDADDPDHRGGIRLRFGAIGWKLSAIELPRATLREIAQRVRRR
jgi:hypothetical protein